MFMSRPPKKPAPPPPPTLKERTTYLQCVGVLMGFTFPADNEDKDKDNAGPAEETAAAEGQEEEHEQEEMTLENLSREKACMWQTGTVFNVLRKHNIPVRPDSNRRWDDYVLRGEDPPPATTASSSSSVQGNTVMKRRLNDQEPSAFVSEVTKKLRLGRDAIGGRPFQNPFANPDGVNDKKGEEENQPKTSAFKTGLEVLKANDKKKGVKRNYEENSANDRCANSDKTVEENKENSELEELMSNEKLKGFEPKIVEAILGEVMEDQQPTDWNDIAGLTGPKAIIKEIIIWPMLRPDIFTGLRSAPKGILLFGPPGTGKTMIGRLIATQSNSTFFNISASSLMSKWIGDGEKLVRCLFQIARIKQPSVIFIDEIDSILTQRSEHEHESSRRIKTEFLIQFDGCGTKQEDKVLVIGVTNRPQELDEAARRRLVKRIYIPLPDMEGRKQIVVNLMKSQHTSLSEEDIDKIANLTDGYSGADMKSVCQEASYGPIREIGHMLEKIDVDKVRPIGLVDFRYALKRVKSSVAIKDLVVYEDWDHQFGCHVVNSLSQLSQDSFRGTP